MSKYCIHQDRPMPGTAFGEQCLPGCEIFGVHHDCKGCPNLVEMGDEPYTISTTSGPNDMANITSVQEKMREKHSLLEWMVILQNNPELLAEFEKECDKQCPPPPIR